MRTFFIENFGCRATQADGAALESLLRERGLKSSLRRDQAELIILNTCTVTAGADSDVRATIRRVHRENPESRILVTGCYAQRAPEELIDMPGVEWVVGNSQKAEIAQIAAEVPYHAYPGGIYASEVFASGEMLSAPHTGSLADRARPNLKIQDGCNNRCSFCIIPAVRGPSRFLSADTVIEHIRELSVRYREVVLTGINLGRWGREAGSSLRLADLLARALDETPVDCLRVSSIEPMDWSDQLIRLMASAGGRIAHHVHMPLQSGSDRILRRMHRKYRPQHYRDRIERAHEALPDAAIGADVMTGFPGETDALFEESCAFIESLPFTYLHVFTYSERPGTRAAALTDSVPMPVRRARTRTLRALSDRKNREFRQRMIGRELRAVTLERPGFALTGNYLTAEINGWRKDNELRMVQVAGLTESGVREESLLPVL